MWRTVCQSAIGSFHVETGLPCQDYGAYLQLGKDVLIGAVADGAGSAKHSDLGAKIAVEAALDFLVAVDNRPVSEPESEPVPPEGELAEIFEKTYPQLLQAVIEQLKLAAEQQKCDFADLATTLLVFIATSNWLAAMQIGDGFILIKPVGENYQLLFQPDKGEYINETTFVTSTNALEEMQIAVLAEPVEFICA
ncbi:MAG: PP2C family serine/threonine-protein phosphatase, partial [Synechocystis sp.]